MNLILQDILVGFRRAIVLLAIERCGLREELLRGYTTNEIPSDTLDRVVLAAAALGLVKDKPFQWCEPYRSLASNVEEWNRTLAIISHQRTYLRIAQTLDSAGNNVVGQPKEQLEAAPEEYFEFLRGVDASHRRHAEWLAQLEELRDAVHLIDLGGGLGTFSRAWVHSRNDRRATLVDLPGVRVLVHVDGVVDDRLAFKEADLLHLPTLPRGDVYLLANVLHLLPQWRQVVASVVTQAGAGSTLVVMEADPSGTAGTLFDLQVHLRSGCIAGLLRPDVISSALTSSGLSGVHSITVSDPSDPFERTYFAWIGHKEDKHREA